MAMLIAYYADEDCMYKKAMQFHYIADPDCLDGFLHMETQNSTNSDTDNSDNFNTQ